ncbi:SDR family oxidoreductase [Paenibacillus sp. FSL R5-0519]|uniref:SDR family oxidoreductase n=1 Tax=Paenibacillus sp. FSL R5-0519 TaxID=2921648 RepID=UPI0030DB73D1
MKTAYVHHAESIAVQVMAVHLLQRGLQVTASFATVKQAEKFHSELSVHDQNNCQIIVAPDIQLKDVESLLSASAEHMQGLDFYIHGSSWTDEQVELEGDPLAFALTSQRQLSELFLYTRAAGNIMARKQKGQMVIPMLADMLHYSGFPSSPVYNQGALAYAKSFAKEMTPFRVAVNTLTWGFYCAENHMNAGRNRRKIYDMYTLKPAVPELEELIQGLGLLLDYGQGMSGQNITWGYGIPSVL